MGCGLAGVRLYAGAGGARAAALSGGARALLQAGDLGAHSVYSSFDEIQFFFLHVALHNFSTEEFWKGRCRSCRRCFSKEGLA